MPPLPEYRARELVKNIEVVRVPDLGEPYRALAGAFGALARKFGETGPEPSPKAGGANPAAVDEAPEPETPEPEHRPADTDRTVIENALAGYRSDFTLAVRGRAANDLGRFADAPEAFDAVWRDYAAGTLAQAPPEDHRWMTATLQRVGRETRAELLRRKDIADTARARTSWQTALGLQLLDLGAQADAGAFGTDRFNEAFADVEGHLRRGVAAGIVGPEAAAEHRHRIADQGLAHTLARRAFADRRDRDAGDAADADGRLNELLGQADSAIPAERRGAVGLFARGELRRLEAERERALAGLRDERQAIEDRVHQGRPGDLARLFELTRDAERLGDARLAADLRDDAAAFAERESFARLSLAEQARLLGDLAEDSDDGTDEAAGRRLDAFARLHAAKDRAMGRDPWTYGLEAHGGRLGPAAALDFARPDALADALKSRVPQADAIAAYEGVAAAPLSRDELGRLGDAVDAGDASQNAVLLAALHDGLGEKHVAAVLRRLSEFGGKAATAAAAGALYAEDPKLARDVLAGDELRRENPKLMPEGDVEATIKDNFIGFENLPPMMQARIVDLALAVYAKESKERGDASGALKPERLSAAVTRVSDTVILSDALNAPESTQIPRLEFVPDPDNVEASKPSGDPSETPTAPQPDNRRSPDTVGPELLQPEPDPETGKKIAAVARDIDGGIVESIPQSLGGVLDAAHNIFSPLSRFISGNLEKYFAETGIEITNAGTGIGIIDRPLAVIAGEKHRIDPPRTATGALFRDMAQFLILFVPASRALKAGGVSNPVARGAVAGAAAGASGLDPYEQGLANLIEKHPALKNPVTNLLAADPNDPEALARFKSAIQYMVRGVLAEGVGLATQFIAAARRAGTAPAQTVQKSVQSGIKAPD